jgi:transposase
MKKSTKFSPEVRERAVRMVREHRDEYPSLWAAIESIAPKIGCVPQTLNEWVKRDQVDTGVRDGITDLAPVFQDTDYPQCSACPL